MSLDAAWASAQDAMFDTMGLSAVVTRPAPDNTPVETQVIWLTPLDKAQPFGSELDRRDPRRFVAVRQTDALTTLPVGSTFTAADTDGGATKTWRVEKHERPVTGDEFRVFVTER